MIVKESLEIENRIIYQDDSLYRFTSDAVILSKFASSKKGDVVADFCSGSGIVGIHHYLLTKNAKSVDLIEIQSELSVLSKMTVEENQLGDIFCVINCPLQDLDNSFNEKYSLILCNPPYKKKGSGEHNADIKKAMCRHEITITQDEIISIASKKLKFGGRLCMCQRTERFTDLIVTMRDCGLEPTKIQMVATAENKPPYLFLIESVKGVKPQLKILETCINR